MTIIKLRYWIILFLVFTSGCTSQYTQRKCLIGLIGQTESGHVLANLFCEKEEPYTPEEKK